MSNIPEDIMGKEGNDGLDTKKPDFGIFEKMEKELGSEADSAFDEVKTAAEKMAEVMDPAEVSVEKIMDSRTRKSMEDTMEIPAEKITDKIEDKAAAAGEKIKETAGDVAEKAEDAKEKVKDAAENVKEKAGALFSKAEAEDAPADPRSVLENKIQNTKRKKGWHLLLIEVIVVVLAVVITFTLILGSSTVKGTSMEPNYFEGDRVLYLKLASNFEQNDVIIFHTEENRDLIKRVIAVEGDVVDIDDGEVLVNGTPVESINVSQDTEKSVSGVSDPVDFPLTVKEDHVFVLGDNRSVSIDSRTKKIGQISKKDIAGRVFYMMRSKTK